MNTFSAFVQPPQVFCLCGLLAFALASLLAVLPLRGCTTSLLCDADVVFLPIGICVFTQCRRSMAVWEFSASLYVAVGLRTGQDGLFGM